jgi:hypothetical protein
MKLHELVHPNQPATVVSRQLRDVETKLVTPAVSQIIEAALLLNHVTPFVFVRLFEFCSRHNIQPQSQ